MTSQILVRQIKLIKHMVLLAMSVPGHYAMAKMCGVGLHCRLRGGGSSSSQPTGVSS